MFFMVSVKNDDKTGTFQLSSVIIDKFRLARTKSILIMTLYHSLTYIIKRYNMYLTSISLIDTKGDHFAKK